MRAACAAVRAAAPLLGSADRRRTRFSISRNDALGLVGAAMRHQPARAFRNPEPHEEDDSPSAAPIRKASRQPNSGSMNAGSSSTIEPAAPIAAPIQKLPLMHEVGPAAHARRDQFLDGGIDRGIFAADAGAGEKAKQREAPEIPRQRGRRGRDEVDRERDEEQLLAAEPVGQPAEEQRAEHRAGEIGAADKPDLGVGELQRRALLSARPTTRPRA